MKLQRPLTIAAGLALGLSLGAAVADSHDMASYKAMFEPIPSIAPIPADNTQTAIKVELGKMLFFEPRISASGIISCATCHNPALGFTDRIPLAVGHLGQVGERNTPTVLNAAFLGSQFWDGRAATLEEQALGPIEADIEMAMPLDEAVQRLKEFDVYKEMFAEVFGGDDPINADNVAKSLASFQRTLITPNSPLDRYLAGDEQALTDQQKRGMRAFVDRGCVACHRGPALSDSQFHRIQVPGSTDLGRYLVTGEEHHRHAFRTPTLRNVAVTYPYFNNGQVATLDEATRVMGREMLNLELPDGEVADLVAFMHALTGDMPDFAFPALP
ncbi:cytochrome-c peroxidase [Thioalkalivibrio thiocyanodenitrificans]|uniref:cytochrome-c peroxidase n=1 Tax=Thioalkalivibrio thiocyanodenitrificans TaxID=243063 RepID=UPI000363EB22|nr:cytochrome-c peroxidase [Thioalkalivibrio thiocyanodenitrificans]